MSCLFCEIAAGHIPSRKVYEDDKVLAFMDISPVSKGHVLVIPKTHAASFLEAEPEDLQAVFAAAQKIAKHMEETLGFEGINILSNAGEAAGQTVPHFHVHLIPRYNDPAIDKLNLSFSPVEDLDMDQILETIKL